MKNKLYESLFPVINEQVTKDNGGLALAYVLTERDRQDAKWGEQNHDPFTYLTILTEEVGEFAQAALQTRFGGDKGGLVRMREEAVQAAAVALAIVECLDRGKWKWPEPPPALAALEAAEVPPQPEVCRCGPEEPCSMCGRKIEVTHE